MLSAPDFAPERFRGRSALLAGAGNIGSHLAPLLARAGLGTLRIVDRDVVEAGNLTRQDFHPGDVGRPKAEVLAERLRRQFPDRRIEASFGDLEDLPLRDCQVDVILGGLDSRRARQILTSEIAWPLGIPAIDGGVGEGLIGRVQVFLPGEKTACLECTWGEQDYRLLAAEYRCRPGAGAEGPATVSTAFLGNFVAAVMAGECLRVLAGQAGAESYEVPFDLWNHALRRFGLRRNPRCRHDHEVVKTTLNVTAPEPCIGDLLALFPGEGGQLEVRSGESRFVPLEALRVRAQEPLAALGLAPGDRVRARGPRGSVWVRVAGQANA